MYAFRISRYASRNGFSADIAKEEGEGFDCLRPDCGVMDEEELPGRFVDHRVSDDVIVVSDFIDSLDHETCVRQ